MKKIMIMVAAAVAAVAVNAASVSWTVNNLRLPGVTDPTVDQFGMHTTTADAAFTPAQGIMLTILWNNDGTWEQITSGGLTGNGIKAKEVLWDQATAVANRDSSNNAYFKLITEYTTDAGTYTFTQESGAVALGNIESTAKTVTFNANNGTWDYTAAAVPEPTSGLMLLLGMAGLALRRRRA